MDVNVEHYLCLSGSRLYGCESDNSDKDVVGFAIPSYEALLGRSGGLNDGTDVKMSVPHDTKDVSIWTVGHYFHLLEKGATTAIESLFVPQDKIIQDCPAAQLIRANAQLFLSYRVENSFIGFAESNYKKYLAGGDKAHKSLYHAIRIAFQLIQIQKTGRIDFHLLPHPILKRIKENSFPSEKAVKIYNTLISICEKLEKEKPLPKIDIKKINDLYFQIIKDSMRPYYKEYLC